MHGSRSLDELSAAANRAAYDATTEAAELAGSPHLRHASLRMLYARLAAQVFARARRHAEVPSVLDLGAGSGAITRSFVELGASVTAVDVSERQLQRLAERSASFAAHLRVESGDAAEVLSRLRATGRRFDVVAAASFLHHIPEYLGIVAAATRVLNPHGQLFVFHDPMSTATISARDRRLSQVAYALWRLRQPDVVGGLRRYARRRRGIWLDDCSADTVEYHELRSGVDQDAIARLLENEGFSVAVTYYFATQSPSWQAVGEKLGARNRFALVAVRTADRDGSAEPPR